MATLGVFRDDFYQIEGVLVPVQYKSSTANLNGTVLAASSIAGAQECYYKASGQTVAQGITTDTAANIIAQLSNSVVSTAVAPNNPNIQGSVWYFELWNANTSLGAITLTAGSGVTITGTTTVAIGVGRAYMVSITGPNSVTLQDLGGSALT